MKLYLAPIQELTVAYYRKLYNGIFGGIDVYYAPFISTTHMRKQSSMLFDDILPKNNEGLHHLVPQLLGNNGSDFNYFASVIADMGYKEINWNIGCPYAKVTRKKKGSGILPYPDTIRAFLDEVCLNPSYELSVKMRLGATTPEEGMKVIELLNDYPLKNIVIHARLGHQIYKGTVDLHAFKGLYSMSKHNIVYNGDIFTVDDFNKFRLLFPSISDYMIGRGALRDPFLPAAIKGHAFSEVERRTKLKSYHDAVLTYYQSAARNEKILCNKMKEFWIYTSYQIDSSGEFLKHVLKCPSIVEYNATCKALFGDMK